MICPTCKREAGDQVCMCGKCPNCDPEHFTPSTYNPDDDHESLSHEIRVIAEGLNA